MEQKEKELLFKDLCARLPYGVQGITSEGVISPLLTKGEADWDILTSLNYRIVKHGWRPYLRSVSNMTKEEKSDLGWIVHDETDGYCTNDKPYYTGDKIVYLNNIPNYIDFMHEHHLDYCGLIEKGLALEAPEGMYNN